MAQQRTQRYRREASATPRLQSVSAERPVDLIVERDDHRIVAVEVKLSETASDADVRHLLWLRERLGDQLDQRGRLRGTQLTPHQPDRRRQHHPVRGTRPCRIGPDVFEDETGWADRRAAVGPSEVHVVDGDTEVDPYGVAGGSIDHDCQSGEADSDHDHRRNERECELGLGGQMASGRVVACGRGRAELAERQEHARTVGGQ